MDVSHTAPSGGSAPDDFVTQGHASRSKRGGSARADAPTGVALPQLCTDGTERLHYNTLKGYPVSTSTSGGMSPAPLEPLV